MASLMYRSLPSPAPWPWPVGLWCQYNCHGQRRDVESLVSTGTKTRAGRASVAAVFEAKEEIPDESEPPSLGTLFRRIVMPGCAVDLFRPSESQKRR